MITYAPKIKQVKKNKPKITLKKVFQGYKQSSQTGKAVRQRLQDKKVEPPKKKNKKKNKNKY